jgi:hypothetical protein
LIEPRRDLVGNGCKFSHDSLIDRHPGGLQLVLWKPREPPSFGNWEPPQFFLRSSALDFAIACE